MACTKVFLRLSSELYPTTQCKVVFIYSDVRIFTMTDIIDTKLVDQPFSKETKQLIAGGFSGG